MKNKLAIIATGAFALATATSALADVTVEITGATAFRAATLATIKQRFIDSGAAFSFTHDQAAGGLNGSTRAIFRGTYPGVGGVTTIRTSFSGSVEGIRALVSPGATYNATYLAASTLSSSPAIGGKEVFSTSSPVEAAAADAAFSDVSIASTPEDGTVLNSLDEKAGVVVFTMITNEGAPASLTNISSKQFQTLFVQGKQPLDVITGSAADAGKFAVATGRNDGSGTRTTYMAETGLGITSLVKQYVVNATSGDTITQIHLVPQGGLNPVISGDSASNASTIWGQDVLGNGGYNSGSALRGDLAKTSHSTTLAIPNPANTTATITAALDIQLITFLGTPDAVTARNGGARILGYNGVTLTDIAGSASVIGTSDREKIIHGSYTAWGYEQFYRRNDTEADAQLVYEDMLANVGGQLQTTGNGIALGDMLAARDYDGGPVAQ